MFVEVLRSTQVPLVAGWREWRLPKQEKQSFMTSLAQAVLFSLLVLKCRRVLMPSFTWIDASQLDNWHSVFQSVKEVIVTSFEILDLGRCAWHGFLGASHSNTKPREKSFLSGWRFLKLREKPSYLGMLQQVKPGSLILSLRQKFNPWNDTILNLPGRKKFRSLHQRIRSWSLVFWDYEGVIVVDAMSRGETVKSDAYIRMLTELWKRFKLVRPHKNPTELCLSMTKQGCTQAWWRRDLSQNLVGEF